MKDDDPISSFFKLLSGEQWKEIKGKVLFICATVRKRNPNQLNIEKSDITPIYIKTNEGERGLILSCSSSPFLPTGSWTVLQMFLLIRFSPHCPPISTRSSMISTMWLKSIWPQCQGVVCCNGWGWKSLFIESVSRYFRRSATAGMK